MRSLAARYAVLLREPGVPRFVALSFVMRMPLGTVGLATLLHVREITGSIAFAGSVVGAMLVAAAAAAPIQGRLIDRHGPRGVLIATGLVAPLALLAILLARPLDLARPGLLAAAVVAGAFSPPVTVIVRTLLRARFAEGALRQSAFALDAVLLELAYTAGPLLIAAAIALDSSTAAMAVALLFLSLAVPLLFLSGGLAWRHREAPAAPAPAGPACRDPAAAPLRRDDRAVHGVRRPRGRLYGLRPRRGPRPVGTAADRAELDRQRGRRPGLRRPAPAATAAAAAADRDGAPCRAAVRAPAGGEARGGSRRSRSPPAR